jgi:anti-sigma B factor antagonist
MAKLGGAGGAEAAVSTSVDETGAAIVTLTGELDISNVDQLRTQLDPVLEQAPAKLVFDLTGLQFMDSSGIAVLLQVAARIGDVCLRNPTQIVRRLVASTGLADALPIEP